MEPRRRWLSALSLVVTLACGGCVASNGASSSMAQAKVRGKVTLKGKPLTRAEIRFNPANVYRKNVPTAAATLGGDGSYEVTTLIGENTVTLSGRALGKNTQLQYTARSLDVKEGNNTFDVPLE